MEGRTSQKHSRTLLARAGKRLRRGMRRIGWWWSRSLSLSQRLLIGAVVVVSLGMVALGYWTGQYIQDGITRGVSTTAAASIDALISWQLESLNIERPLSAADNDRLDAVFAIGNDASLTRLLQIRIHELDGSLLFDSQDGLIDREDTTPFVDAAKAGAIVANIRDLAIEPIGPIEGHTISVLKVYAPIHRASTSEVYAVAELYFSAASLSALQAKAQADVWLLVAGTGVGVVGLLYLLVSRTSQLIRSQRERLAINLSASRKLADENRALHEASEDLRLTANSANEGLLAQVGSDIHDGPIQLLALIILRLTGHKKGTRPEDGDRQSTIQLATEALEDLRNISNGLVLPELAEADLIQTLALAITRHENLTGSTVRSEFSDLPRDVSAAVKACAYRIVQEGLNNAFRHGGPMGQVVRASQKGGSLIIEIANPYPATASPNAAEHGRSPLGLHGMRFRVESLGGELRTDIGTSELARIVATIPWEAAASSTSASGKAAI